jgi:hypothetical protein
MEKLWELPFYCPENDLLRTPLLRSWPEVQWYHACHWQIPWAVIPYSHHQGVTSCLHLAKIRSFSPSSIIWGSPRQFCNKTVFCSPYRWAFTITCCPSSSSVDTACFVTTRAIDLKLCTYVPLAIGQDQVSVRSDSWLGGFSRLWGPFFCGFDICVVWRSFGFFFLRNLYFYECKRKVRFHIEP